MPEENEESASYEVLLTDEAYLAYVALTSDRVFEHVTHSMELLEASPLLGQVYDPAYEAKRPPFSCRVLFCEHYGIYYLVDESELTIHIVAIEDQRRDPLNRFSSFVYAVESFD